MNAWEIDPNLQLSVYTAIWTRFILIINKLVNWFGRTWTFLSRHGKRLVEIADGREISLPADIASNRDTATAETGFNKIRIANFR